MGRHAPRSCAACGAIEGRVVDYLADGRQVYVKGWENATSRRLAAARLHRVAIGDYVGKAGSPRPMCFRCADREHARVASRAEIIPTLFDFPSDTPRSNR